MSDYIHQENGYRLEVWETNKGPALGYFKWCVKRWERETETWETVARCQSPEVYDGALRQGQWAYEVQQMRS